MTTRLVAFAKQAIEAAVAHEEQMAVDRRTSGGDMTDLPSRDAVRHSDNIHDFPTYLERVLLPLAEGWRSGRLVDREAIDYEAMARELLAAGAFRDRNILSAAAYEPLMRTMVLAALGEETP